MGGLEQLHPLFRPLCGWAGGQEGQEESQRRQSRLRSAVSGRQREREMRREGKGGREGEEQAPGLGVGERCTTSHLSNRWFHPPDPPHRAAGLGEPGESGGSRGGEEGSYRTGCSNMCPGEEALPGAGRVSGSPGMGGSWIPRVDLSPPTAVSKCPELSG